MNNTKIIAFEDEVGAQTEIPTAVSPSKPLPVISSASFNIPQHDYIALTYVAAGSGVGEIETVVYKSGGSGGTTVATLTLAYNASNEISSITKT